METKSFINQLDARIEKGHLLNHSFYQAWNAGELSHETIQEYAAQYFKHVLKGSIECWDVPGINGLNFLLKNSLGGGGMASLNIDPQGKAYAQQLLEYKIPVSQKISQKVT